MFRQIGFDQHSLSLNCQYQTDITLIKTAFINQIWKYQYNFEDFFFLIFSTIFNIKYPIKNEDSYVKIVALWPNLTSRDHDLNNLGMLPHSFKLFWQIVFWEDLKKFNLIYSCVKIWHCPHSIGPNPTPGDHKLNKLESTLSKEISKFQLFWPKGFWDKDFLKIANFQ